MPRVLPRTFAALLLHLASAERDGKLRFSGWHDKLADRKKGLYDRATQMLTPQQNRELAMRAIARHMRARAGQLPANDGTELYEFGVYTGGGLRKWLQNMRREGIAFAGHVWGFDSFEGMPSEDAKYKTKLRQRDKGWLAGGLNAAEQMGVADWPTLCQTLIRNIAGGSPSDPLVPSERVHMVRGFYNESLMGGRRFAAKWRMAPALLIDLDCDLYTSSAQALEFVLEADLLVPGSYIYLDDVMPWVWADATTPPLEQKLAFLQASDKWGLGWEEVPLNATRRERVDTRPVLMLTRCDACRRRRAKRAVAEGAADLAPPPNCMVPYDTGL